MFDPTDVVRRRSDVTVRIIQSGGALLIDMTSGRCWQLNRLGADFLAQIDSEKALGQVCDTLGSRYDVPREVLERDLCRLAQELVDAGLVERVGS
jgi:Coenzyme PQQ synthesis protein D (PqqD)